MDVCKYLINRTILFTAFALLANNALAQSSLCVFTHGLHQHPLSDLRSPSKAAIKDVSDIMKALGYDRDDEIPIYSGHVANAAAFPAERGRGPLIVYNPEFLTRLFNINDWAATSVIAHEIGHHIAKNANDPNPHGRELAADEISGCALARMGASLQDATAALLKGLPNNPGSSTHPSTRSRLEAIVAAYHKCK